MYPSYHSLGTRLVYSRLSYVYVARRRMSSTFVPSKAQKWKTITMLVYGEICGGLGNQRDKTLPVCVVYWTKYHFYVLVDSMLTCGVFSSYVLYTEGMHVTSLGRQFLHTSASVLGVIGSE